MARIRRLPADGRVRTRGEYSPVKWSFQRDDNPDLVFMPVERTAGQQSESGRNRGTAGDAVDGAAVRPGKRPPVEL